MYKNIICHHSHQCAVEVLLFYFMRLKKAIIHHTEMLRKFYENIILNIY